MDSEELGKYPVWDLMNRRGNDTQRPLDSSMMVVYGHFVEDRRFAYPVRHIITYDELIKELNDLIGRMIRRKYGIRGN